MKKCSNGHLYDRTIHKYCPYCNVENVINPTNNIAVKKKGRLRNLFSQTETASKHTIISLDEESLGEVSTPILEQRQAKYNIDSESIIQDKANLSNKVSLLGDFLPVGFLFIEGDKKSGSFVIYNTVNFVVLNGREIEVIPEAYRHRSNHPLLKITYVNGDCIIDAVSSLAILNNDELRSPRKLRNKDIITIKNIMFKYISILERGFSW